MICVRPFILPFYSFSFETTKTRLPAVPYTVIYIVGGVSAYSGAVVDRIKEVDEQWERIWWEFKSGERKIFSDAAQISAGQIDDRLFLRGTFTSGGDLF